MKWRSLSILIFSLLCVVETPTFAAETALTKKLPSKRIGIDTSKNVRINYGCPAWNKSSTAFDSASILMRDGATGRVIQINLSETAPDSAVFSGLYQLSFADIQRLQVEFYIPDQATLAKVGGLRQIISDIDAGRLHRIPFILRRQPNGLQSVEIFDTKDQAREAMKAYRAEQQLAVQNGKTTKYPSDQENATAQLAKEMALKMEMASAAAERQRMAQIEAKRMADLMAAQAAQSEAQRLENKEKAKALAEQGMALFQQEKFPEARAKFDQAVALDPDNQMFYYQYGVALYKVDDFNRSLVMLKMAKNPSINKLERDYFIALDYFRLKEYDNSVAVFDHIVKAKDPVMSPSAEFYKGVVLFEEKKWEDSQTAFQSVLDTSSDPKLDERAEAYLEQILRIRQFEEQAKHKWLLTATLGGMYDSNILLTSDSQRDAGTASNSDGFRSLFTGSAKYRPIFNETTEFAAQLDVTTMYTVTTSFQGDQNLRNNDPNVATLTAPYTHKGMLLGKGYKLDVTPGYESTYMSIENNKNKEILSSLLLGVSNLFVMNEKWFANYNLDIRQDNSELSSSTGNDDATALKVKLTNSNIMFVSDDKSRILLADGAYTTNNAKGRNAVYNRIDLSAGYIRPWKWDTSVNFKLGYFLLNYPQNTSGRTDNSYTLSTGLSKKLSEIWTTGFLASYNINQSNVDTNTYKKWTALLTLSAAYGF